MDTKTKKRRVGAPTRRAPSQTAKTKTAGTGNAAVRRSTPRRRRPAADVVYVPPKPFNRNRFLLHMATVLAVVLVVVLLV